LKHRYNLARSKINGSYCIYDKVTNQMTNAYPDCVVLFLYCQFADYYDMYGLEYIEGADFMDDLKLKVSYLFL